MAGLVESFKKVFGNKKANIELFIVAFVWTLLSNMFDIFIGKPNNFRQNPFDLLFSFIIGMYSIQFLHNAVTEKGGIPFFNVINWKALPGLIWLNVVWSFYLGIYLILCVISYLIGHAYIIPITLMILIFLISVFVYYIYIAYAESFKAKGLFDIRLIFYFVKFAFKETYIKLIQYVLLTLAFCLVYLVIYLIAGYCGIDKLVNISGDTYLIDLILYVVFGYFIIMLWYFMFPYSLIDVYIDKIRPFLIQQSAEMENV